MSELDVINDELIHNLTQQVGLLKDNLTLCKKENEALEKQSQSYQKTIRQYEYFLSLFAKHGDCDVVCCYCGDTAKLTGCCGEVHNETKYFDELHDTDTGKKYIIEYLEESDQLDWYEI